MDGSKTFIYQVRPLSSTGERCYSPEGGGQSYCQLSCKEIDRSAEHLANSVSTLGFVCSTFRYKQPLLSPGQWDALGCAGSESPRGAH